VFSFHCNGNAGQARATCLDEAIPLEDNERIDMLIEPIRSDLTRQGESCIAESETSEIDQEA